MTLILRPSGAGTYANWGVVPGVPLWQTIDEPDSDGDASYCWADSSTTNPFFSVLVNDAEVSSFPRPVRISSLRVVATVRTTGVSADFKFRIRYLGTNYDSDAVTCGSSSYIELDKLYTTAPNLLSDAWTVTRLQECEFGIVWDSGDLLRCTKLEVFIHTEMFPHYTLTPNANGTYNGWTNYPGNGPDYMTQQKFDGDLSYMYSSAADTSTFELDDLGGLFPPNIDRVQAKALVKNVGVAPTTVNALVRDAAGDYLGATNNAGHEIPADDRWHVIADEYLNSPAIAWPSGNPAAGAWLAAQVNALEIGVRNTAAGDVRWTSTALDVWLSQTPVTTINQYPTSDSATLADWAAVVPPQVPGNRWQNVDEVPPDNATSYVEADALAAGTPQYCAFGVGGAGAVPAGERIYNVEARYRIRLAGAPFSSCTVAPVVRDPVAGETYVGKPIVIDDTAVTWFDVKHDFHTNPFDDTPWANVAAVQALEWGFAVLQGACYLTRVRAQIQTAYDYRAASGAVDLQLTNAANFYMNRSIGDGTIYAITDFAVGVGGYNPAIPTTVVAVNPALGALLSEVYRAPVTHMQYDAPAAAPPWTVQYWCRVPRDEAMRGLGEIGLIATILWSPLPAEIGTQFLFANQHFPCQSRHRDAVSLFVVEITY